MTFDPTRLIALVASFLAVVVVLTLHEFSHAFVAYRCGDPTPKLAGRLSLNPLRHFDIVGLICFTLVGFGWAKPVPIEPVNFKKYRLGLGLTASAGVVMNYLCAFVFYPLWMLVCTHLPYVVALSEFLESLTYYLWAYSLSFCVFNLLPLFPLDGFRILETCSKRTGRFYRFMRKYSVYVLLFLVAESFLCGVFVDFGVGIMGNFDILGWIMRFATGIFGYPVRALWGLIPW